MPQNFFKVLVTWLAILIVINNLIMQVNLYYNNKLSTGEYNDLLSLFMVLAFIGMAIRGLIVGLGLRHLVRSNNYNVSVGAIFGFTIVFIFIPFLIFTAQTFYYHSLGSFDRISGSIDTRQLYIMVLSNFIITLMIIVVALSMAGQWRMFRKAEREGWKSIIPVLSMVEMTQIAKKPVSWVFLLFIPLINIIVYILLLSNLAKSFNKSGEFALGLFFLPFIFFPILGFGDAKYQYAENEFEIEEDGLELEEHLVE